MRLGCLVLFVAVFSMEAQAQAPATLAIEVVDSTGGVLPGAAVSLWDNGTLAADTRTDGNGLATLRVPAGSYDLIVAADAFDSHSRRIDLRGGRASRVRVELALPRISETVTVAAETSNPAETVISQEQIGALANDPEALNDFIRDLGGPDADVRIDGFQGGRLPPREQVAQVIVTSDPYAAQFHEVGRSRVNVVTRPGFGEWRGAVSMNIGDDCLQRAQPVCAREAAVSEHQRVVLGAGPRDAAAHFCLDGRYPPPTNRAATDDCDRAGWRARGSQGPEAGISVAAFNVLNRAQFGSFNGVITSPLYGRPISAFNSRRVDLSLHVRF